VLKAQVTTLLDERAEHEKRLAEKDEACRVSLAEKEESCRQSLAEKDMVHRETVRKLEGSLAEKDELEKAAREEALEWKAAAEMSIAEGVEEVAALTETNRVLKEENEKLVGEVSELRELKETEIIALKEELDETQDAADSFRALAAEERQEFESSLKANDEEVNLFKTKLEDERREFESSLEAKDEESISHDRCGYQGTFPSCG